MGRVLRFLKWAGRSNRRNRKPRKQARGHAPHSRRLVCEPLETRTLLSAGGATQHLTVADLPVAAQQVISSAIGQDEAAYQAAAGAAGVTLANPANSFITQVQSGAMLVSAGSDTWGMSLGGLSYGGALQPVGIAQTAADGNRVDCNYGTVDEWYVNGPGGLEQGFNVPLSPQSEASGLLTVELALGGNLKGNVDAAGNGLTLTRPDGSAALGYTGLAAYDATGKKLPASLQVEIVGGRQELLIHVDDAEAQGPIIIDPLVQEAEAHGVGRRGGRQLRRSGFDQRQYSRGRSTGRHSRRPG